MTEKISREKNFKNYLLKTKADFPGDRILQEIHAIRLMLFDLRKSRGLSLEQWSRELNKEVVGFAKNHGLRTLSV